MRLVSKAYAATRSAAAMAVWLTRATGRPDMAVRYAATALARRDRPVDIAWHGLLLSARGTDWPALQEVLIENEYGALAPYLQAKPRPVVLDIGANIGTFALYALSIARGATVHSFEPSPTTFALLDSTRARNPASDWHAHRAAVWSEDGAVAFAAGPASTAGRVAAGGAETVPALSLASIMRLAGGRADIAKLDIEGAEEAVLTACPTLLASIETIVVELHPGRCDTARVSHLLRHSYGSVHAIPGRRSAKPLLLATRHALRPALPLFHA